MDTDIESLGSHPGWRRGHVDKHDSHFRRALSRDSFIMFESSFNF